MAGMESTTDTPERLALDRAVASAQGKTELMRRLNDKGHQIGSHNTISQWRVNGVPAKYCPDLEVITGVLCEELCPGTNWSAIRAPAQTFVACAATENVAESRA